VLYLYDLIAEKSSIYGQMSHTVEPSGTPDLSPVTANDDNLDAAGSMPNRIHDEVDDDDLFSKRRYYSSEHML
jgi:hypothetical protein